jgi:hypothetical protein
MGVFRSSVDDRLILPAQVRLTAPEAGAFQALGRRVPGPIPVRLIIDTGSKLSSIVPSILDRLMAKTAGRAKVETTIASAETELFWICIEFPGCSLAAVPRLAVARLSMPPSLRNYHGVVGLDLLKTWEALLYEGRRGRFTVRDSPGGLFGWLKRQ